MARKVLLGFESEESGGFLMVGLSEVEGMEDGYGEVRKGGRWEVV